MKAVCLKAVYDGSQTHLAGSAVDVEPAEFDRLLAAGVLAGLDAAKAPVVPAPATAVPAIGSDLPSVEIEVARKPGRK